MFLTHPFHVWPYENEIQSAFLSQKLWIVFLIFGTLCNWKQVNINHVFYFVTPHEIKSCEKLNSWQRASSEKGQSILQYQLTLTFEPLIFTVRSVVTKYLVIKDAIHNIEGFKTTILGHF